MPLTRYQIRNEYGLADPELYKAAEKDDPEALLEGVAMAGLVGVLRQLGDLAEFAAEIFHDLHEEVMATAARGHGLVARVQQLESDFPSIEKAFLSQTSHSPFFSAPGVDWHPNMRSQQNLVTRGDLPRFVMDSYEECRGPPRLFLLDKFDVAGAGACLKRYTDPSFFKVEAKSNEVPPTADAQREKKMRKVKKKAARTRNGETSGIAPTSHSKLHQLLMEERIENGYNNPPRALKIKKRHLNGYPFDSKTGKSYMVQFVETPSPEHKVVHEVPVSPRRLKFRSSNTSEIAKDVCEVDTANHVGESPQRNERSCSPPYAPEIQYKPSIDDDVKEEVVDRLSEVVPVLSSSDGETDETPTSPHEVMDKKMCPSDDVISDVENYTDARTTLESEIESGNEFRIKNDLGSDPCEEDLKFQTDVADSDSVANSSASGDDNGSFKKGMSSVSFSDTSTSNLAENEPCVTEVMEAPSNKSSASDVLESKSDELEVPSDEYVEESKSLDTRETSPSNNLSTGEIAEPESGELEVPNDTKIEEVKILDTRATSCGALSSNTDETEVNVAEPESGELEVPNDTNVEEVKILDTRTTSCGTISSSTDETEINVADSSDVFSSIPSQNGDHILFAGPDQTGAVNKFNTGDPDVISDANVAEGTNQNKDSDCSGSEVLQVNDTERYCTENVNNGEIGLPHSASPTDELLFSALPEVEVSSVTVTEGDDAILSTEVNLENLAPKVDVPESRNSTEDQLDRDLDERSDTVDDQETDRHSCDADDAERVFPLELPCHSNYADSEDCVNVGDVIAETVQAEDVSLFSSECLVDTEVKEVNQLEVALTDSDSVLQNSVSYSESKLQVLDDAEDISVTEPDQNSSHASDVTTTSIPSQVRNQVPEPMSLQPDDLVENSEDALPSSRLHVDEDHIENLQVDKEQLQSPIYKDQEQFDVSKSSPEDRPDQAALSELSQHSQAIGLNDSPLPNFSVHSLATQVSPSAESCPDNLPSELSSSELQGNQAVDQLDSSFPFFGIFPEATPDHMEMPPLPPLPPMQWRMGKVHNTPFPSLRESLQSNQDSCNTVLSSGADEKVKLGLLPAVEDERPFTLQEPNMVNDLAEEVRQSPDTSLTLPAISDDRAAHASHMLGGEMTQSSYVLLPLQAAGDATSTHDPVSSQANPIQPLNQVATETETAADTDAKMLEHIAKDLDGQGDTSLNTFAPPLSIEDEQPRNGEIAWYPKTSAFVPFFEVPKPNGNSTMKIPRPRSPLIDAVAAHDKSTLRKVTERVRPQNEPKLGERDSLLEQIRTKSFNLKPAVVTRPSIQGPKTNLKVAAILEKANAIRQALAGSDDDDDTASNWSDS